MFNEDLDCLSNWQRQAPWITRLLCMCQAATSLPGNAEKIPDRQDPKDSSSSEGTTLLPNPLNTCFSAFCAAGCWRWPRGPARKYIKKGTHCSLPRHMHCAMPLCHHAAHVQSYSIATSSLSVLEKIDYDSNGLQPTSDGHRIAP